MSPARPGGVAADPKPTRPDASKRRRALHLALTLVLFLACEPSDEAPPPDTFRYHLVEGPSTLDPARVEDWYSLGVVDRLFDGLMRLDRVRGSTELELAESVEISEDGRLITFELRSGRTFHDGTEIRAVDFKSSWERLLLTDRAVPGVGMFELVEGASAFRAGEAETVTGFEVLDSRRLRIRLQQPFAPFLYHLADPTTSVVPVEHARTLGTAFGRQPVGSGPFRLVSWEGDRLELEAVSQPDQAPPRVRRLIYRVADREDALRLYRSGELDLVSDIPGKRLSTLRQTLPRDLRIFPGIFWYGFCFLCGDPPYDDPTVRQALSLAIDREALAEALGTTQYRAAFGLLPQGVPGHDPSTLGDGYDLERARQLLSESGYPGGQGFPVIDFVTHRSELETRVAEILLDQWSNLGLDGNVQTLDFEELLDAQAARRFPLSKWRWAGEYPDPEPYLRPVFHHLGAANELDFRDDQVDQLLEAGRRETDPRSRLVLYQQAERRILELAPCVALYQRSEAILLRPGWEGIPIGVDGAYLEIERARWGGTP